MTKKLIIYIVSTIIIFTIGYKIGGYNAYKMNNENNSSDVTNENFNNNIDKEIKHKTINSTLPQDIRFDSFDTSNFKDLLCNGTYRCGSDFAPGDYYVLSLYGAETGYNISDSLNNIKYDEDKILRKIHAENGQYIKIGYALLIPESMIDVNNWSKYGVFAVGVDLKPGEYKIEKTTDECFNADYDVNVQGTTLSAYQIFDGSPENSNSIKCSILFDNQEYIELKDGQYIAINNAALTCVSD